MTMFIDRTKPGITERKPTVITAVIMEDGEDLNLGICNDIIHQPDYFDEVILLRRRNGSYEKDLIICSKDNIEAWCLGDWNDGC